MSNVATLTATTFIHSTGTCYGYTICDDYGKSYYDCAEKLTHKDFLSDLGLLQMAIETQDDVSSAIIDNCRETEKGMNINGTFYDFDEIKHLL